MHKYIFINGGYITSKERDDVIPHSHDPYQCRGVFYFDAKLCLEYQLDGRGYSGLLDGLLLGLFGSEFATSNVTTKFKNSSFTLYRGNQREILTKKFL